jgi:hypothetical protein
MEPAEIAEAGERVFYLYGVIPRGQPYPSEEGVALEAVVHADLVALVEPVCAREFSSAALDTRLEDLAWVGRLARRHESVLEGVMRHGVVAPARLCTLFSSALALRQSLAANEQRFRTALQRMRGRREWGVKAFCAEGRIRAQVDAGDAKVRSLNAALATATPGHAFVLRKQRETRRAELAAARIYEVLDEAGEALERAVVDLRLLPLRHGDEPAGAAAEAGESPETMVLNLAALVDEAAYEAFDAVVARLADCFRDEGFRFELSGPWPPYNFCAQAEDGAPSGALATHPERL